MNYEKLKQFRFWDTVDDELFKERINGSRRLSLYPSEACVIAEDHVSKRKTIIGGCRRKVYYRISGAGESNPPGIKAQYIFEFGRTLEGMITELCKKAGIYNNNSVKFWDSSTGVSGEIDVVVESPEGDIIFIEAKSTYGYHKEKQHMDHYEGAGRNRRLVKGTPQDSHLLQLGTYLWNFRENPKIIGGKIVYILRDSMSRAEFDVVVEQCGDKHRLSVNGELDKRFFLEDLETEYRNTKEAVVNILSGKSDQIPERDYSLIYSERQIIDFADNYEVWRRLSPHKAMSEKEKETALTALEKQDKPKGDFECSYCSFRDLCWKNTPELKLYAPPEKRV